MRNCFVHGAYGSGVWTSEIADDFDFRDNVIANGNYVWTYQSGASAGRDPDAGTQGSRPATVPEKQRVHYKVVNSLFAANKKMASSGTAPTWVLRTSTLRFSNSSTPKSRTSLSLSSLTRPRRISCIP